MRVNAIKCPTCGDVIYSRAVHDYRPCTCGASAIDGGFDYIRVTGANIGNLKVINVKATKMDLYRDWNLHLDKFGLIPGENGIKRAARIVRKRK